MAAESAAADYKKELHMSTRPTQPLRRLWHQSMTELEGLAGYRDFLVSHARSLLADEATVQVEGLRAGTYHGRTPTAALGNAPVDAITEPSDMAAETAAADLDAEPGIIKSLDDAEVPDAADPAAKADPAPAKNGKGPLT